MAEQPQQEATLTDYLNKLGTPVANLGIKELMSLLGLGSGVSSGNLTSSGISMLGSLLPLISGDKANPALTMIGTNLAQTLNNLATGSLPSALGSMGTVVDVADMLGGVSGLGSLSNTLGINTGVGLGSGAVGAAINPVGAMMTGQSDWTNPYSGYAQILDVGLPLVGTVLGGLLESWLGNDTGQRHDIEQAFAPIHDASQARLKALRDAGYTDWDIYNYAQANNMLTENDDTLQGWGYGGGSTIGALYTPEEANAKAQIRGADKDTGATGWQYVEGKGWTTGGGTWEATNESAPPPGWFDPVYQQDVPTLANANQLLGNPDRQVTLGSDDYTPYFTPGEQYDYGYSESWGSPVAYDPYVAAPFDPANKNNAKIWDNYYLGDRIAAGGGHAMDVPQYLNTHPVALADWIQYHPGQPLPEGVTANVGTDGNRTGTSPTPNVPTVTGTSTTPTAKAVDPTAPVIDYNKLAFQGDMSSLGQYMRQNPQYASALQGNTESKRLQSPASVPTFASTPSAGNWVNEDAWKNIWGKTFYGGSSGF